MELEPVICGEEQLTHRRLLLKDRVELTQEAQESLKEEPGRYIRVSWFILHLLPLHIHGLNLSLLQRYLQSSIWNPALQGKNPLTSWLIIVVKMTSPG